MRVTVPALGTETVTVGILRADGTWLVEPVVMPQRVSFDTDSSDRIRIALDSRASFTVGDAAQLDTVAAPGFYTDQLVACRSRYIPRSPGCKPIAP